MHHVIEIGSWRLHVDDKTRVGREGYNNTQQGNILQEPYDVVALSSPRFRRG